MPGPDRERLMLLGVDTCGATGGVAIGNLEAGTVQVTAARELAGKTFAARLVPEMRELLEQARLTVHDLRGVVVANGPGSFTGIRIGLSAAKGLAEALKIPIAAVSRLEMLARRRPEEVCAVLDAGRGEFYARIAGGEALMDREELLRLIPKGNLPVVICEPALLESLADVQPVLVEPPTAADALALGGAAGRLRGVRRCGDAGCELPAPLGCGVVRQACFAAGGRSEEMMGDGEIRLRLMTSADLDAVLTIGVDTPEAPVWPRAAYLLGVESDERIAVVSEGSDGVDGFAVARVAAGEAELESIAVRREARRYGTGAALLASIADRARSAGAARLLLEVRASNEKAIRLYRRAGAAIDGRRQGYYADPEEDAVLMTICL